MEKAKLEVLEYDDKYRWVIKHEGGTVLSKKWFETEVVANAEGGNKFSIVNFA